MSIQTPAAHDLPINFLIAAALSRKYDRLHRLTQAQKAGGAA